MAKDEHRDTGDFDESGESSHAADEPTAVWDMEALRKAGLSELANLPDQPESAPATPAEGMAQQRPSMIVDAEKAQAALQNQAPRPVPVAQQAGAGAAGWAGLLALAALIGGVAYLAIRFLR